MIGDGPLLLVVVLASLFGIGHGVCRALGLRVADDPLAWAGWCATAGYVVLSGTFTLLWWLVPASHSELGAVLVPAGLAGAVFFVARRAGAALRPTAPPSPTAPPRARSFTTPERLALGAAIAVGLLWVGALALDVQREPSLIGDSAFLFGLKAQAIRVAGGLGDDFAALLERPVFYHRDYPLGVTTLRAWVHALAGEQAFVAERWPIQALALAWVPALAAALRRFARPGLAAALLLACLAADEARFVLPRAQGEVVVALGLTVACDGLARARAERSAHFLTLAGFGLAGALMAKNEGRLWCLLLVSAFGVGLPFLRGERAWLLARPAWLGLGIAGAGLALVVGFNAYHGFENDLLTAKGADVGLLERAIDLGPERAWPVGRFFLGDILLSGSTGGALLLLALLAVPVLWRRAPSSPQAPALATAVIGLVGLYAIYVTTPQELGWHLDTSAARVAWQLTPAAALGLAGTLGRAAASDRPEGG